MLLRVGIDLVLIERIDRIYKKFPQRFLDRIMTEAEQSVFKKNHYKAASLAARFAAKEAVLKAIGCGIGPAALNEVVIHTSKGQAPQVELLGQPAEKAAAQGINAVALSLTHEPPFACACAAAYRAQEHSAFR